MPSCASFQEPLALLGIGRSREDAPADVRRIEEWAELARVLARKHLGRRHHGRLASAVGTERQGEGRDDGLARTDISQEHPVHAARCGHIIHDVCNGLLLLACECIRELRA